MLERAEESLSSAWDDREADPPRPNRAYDSARTAAEVAGKAMLLVLIGSYPTAGKSGHNIGGLLADKGLVPPGMSHRRLAVFLKEHTRAVYGFADPVPLDEMNEAIEMAEAMVANARRLLGF